MNKENILFAIVGLMGGLILGFLFANSMNRSAAMPNTTVSAMSQNSNMPPGHPDVPNQGGGSDKSMGASAPEVQAAIEKARKEPDNFDAQLGAAEFYYQIERYDGAIEFLLQANKLKPDSYQVLVQLGNTYFDSDKFSEAENWYSKALSIKPNDVNVRTDLGLTFLLRPNPNYDRAILEFKHSLETDPKHIKTLQNLTVAYTKKGDAANAKATVAKIESIEPTNASIPRLKDEINKIGA